MSRLPYFGKWATVALLPTHLSAWFEHSGAASAPGRVAAGSGPRAARALAPQLPFAACGMNGGRSERVRLNCCNQHKFGKPQRPCLGAL